MTTTERAHPDWPARAGVEVGCDDRGCTLCYFPAPAPGDMIILPDGSRAVVDSSHFGIDFDDGEGPQVLAVCAYSVFRGDGSSRYNADGHVSASGGPCPFVPVNSLRYVGTTEQTFWKWADYPRGGGGVDYTATVNLYEQEQP